MLHRLQLAINKYSSHAKQDQLPGEETVTQGKEGGALDNGGMEDKQGGEAKGENEGKGEEEPKVGGDGVTKTASVEQQERMAFAKVSPIPLSLSLFCLFQSLLRHVLGPGPMLINVIIKSLRVFLGISGIHAGECERWAVGRARGQQRAAGR